MSSYLLCDCQKLYYWSQTVVVAVHVGTTLNEQNEDILRSRSCNGEKALSWLSLYSVSPRQWIANKINGAVLVYWMRARSTNSPQKLSKPHLLRRSKYLQLNVHIITTKLEYISLHTPRKHTKRQKFK
ncbi:uncharacterized protein LOC119647330 [Hermetia illucens]|uniref:uncharacterized protein LOC119647330 n=1 Tax=Hermetia illucens TaxID=343691 RepID=UPI0018CC2930|nr:uncharacterized protein LOC119647330 [Hermetia illucens]